MIRSRWTASTTADAHYDSSTHRLTISAPAAAGYGVLQLADINYFAQGFKTAPAASGTVVTYVACFTSGTRIATPSGEVAIETLRIDDLVATVTGKFKPVKWIGRRAYSAFVVAANPNLRPVVIRAGALGAGAPHVATLVVSPLHALLIDAMLVPAAALVNGATILRHDTCAVHYFHIELDRHNAIFAEGTPAETFMDHDCRAMFENAWEYRNRYAG